MERLRTPEDPLIVFHGTRTIFADIIETCGWTQDSRPVLLADLEKLRGLSKRATHLIGKDSIAFNLNLEKYANESVSPVHFSASGNTALLYASQKGGETIKNLAARCRELASAGHGLFSAAEVDEIQSILARYRIYEQPGRRIVYAVRLHRNLLRGEDSDWLQKAEDWHREVRLTTGFDLGLPIERMGEVIVRKDIPPHHIIAKWVSMLSLEDELRPPGVIGRLDVLIERGFDFIESEGYFSLIHPNAQVPLELKAGESVDAVFEAYNLVCK
jgi:hypothetical protein